ncbi:MAG TPA: hypothetical protein VI278_06010 [Nitrososphaeraceae archaeon]
MKSCSFLKTAGVSAKQELETTFEENIGSKNFDIIVTDGNLRGHEKPNPKTISDSITKNESEAFGITNS